MPPEVGADRLRVVPAHFDDVLQLLKAVPLRLLQLLQHLPVRDRLRRELRVDRVLIHQLVHQVQVVHRAFNLRVALLRRLVHEDLRAVLAVGGVRGDVWPAPVRAGRRAIRTGAMRVDHPGETNHRWTPPPSAECSTAGRCGSRVTAWAPPATRRIVASRGDRTGGAVAADPGNQV